MSEVRLSSDGREARGPALVDLQVNGYAGVSFNHDPSDVTADALHKVAAAMKRRGVAAILPTLITGDPQIMVRRAARLTDLCTADLELDRSFPGLHIEGPFINPGDGPRGAHPKAHATTPAAEPGLFHALWNASRGRIKILTLAPEAPGAVELIAQAAALGVVVSLGHTAAGPEDLAAAVRAGARMSTHLGNGSHAMLPRLANYVQWQLAEDALIASFIADGIHMPLYTLKNFLRAKTPQRSILVTDSTLAAYPAPGRYRQGDHDVLVDESGRVTLAGSDQLAGSALTLDRAVLNVHRHCGLPLETAWAMASTQPAELIGLKDMPSIRAGLGEKGFEQVEWL